MVSCVIFSKVPFIKPLAVLDRSKPSCDIMRDWVSAFEAAVRQPANSVPLAFISDNSTMVCLFCGKLFRYRSMTLSLDVKII